MKDVVIYINPTQDDIVSSLCLFYLRIEMSKTPKSYLF